MTNTERIFVDTDILVYLISSDPAKAATARALVKRAPTISVQILSEFVSVARRKHKKPWEEVLAVTAMAVAQCEVVPVTLGMHERATELAQTAGIDIYDACIVASADVTGCDVLYTEDLNHGQRIGRVEIRSPFT
jgi:predicted nucleic acid-binding protein